MQDISTAHTMKKGARSQLATDTKASHQTATFEDIRHPLSNVLLLLFLLIGLIAGVFTLEFCMSKPFLLKFAVWLALWIMQFSTFVLQVIMETNQSCLLGATLVMATCISTGMIGLALCLLMVPDAARLLADTLKAPALEPFVIILGVLFSFLISFLAIVLACLCLDKLLPRAADQGSASLEHLESKNEMLSLENIDNKTELESASCISDDK